MAKEREKKDRSPSFQFYAKDWRDVKVRRMSLAAQGAYICILADMWIDSKDQCSVLDNDAFLARAMGMPPHEWEAIRAEIQNADEPLLIAKDGRLYSSRLKSERAKQQEYSQKQSLNASKRWSATAMPPHTSGICQTDATTYAKTCSSSSLNTSPLSLPISKKKSTEKEESTVTSSLVLTPEELAERFNQIDGVKPVKMINGKLPPTIHKKARQRISQYNSEAFWVEFLVTIQQSAFLTGKIHGRNGGESFQASFDWIMGPRNFDKIIGGTYAGNTNSIQATMDRVLAKMNRGYDESQKEDGPSHAESVDNHP